MSVSSNGSRPWVADLAESMRAAYLQPVPDDVLDRAAVHVFDALACAAGAIEADAVAATRRATRGSGPQVASVWFCPERVNLTDAVLANGAALRYLDLNDSFIGTGPSGHPSDNIPVALAVGESEQSTGEQVLKSVALGYEMYWRMRKHVYGQGKGAPAWDGTSASGIVSALMAGLLLDLDEQQLTNALAIGAARGYGLKQLRRGSISTLKAAGNSMAAREGTLGALLAREGMTGPAEIIEASAGMLAAFGLEASPELHDKLVTGAPEWVINSASIKMYPSIGTSQAALHGTLKIAGQHKPAPDAIASVAIYVPESATTRDHMSMPERLHPKTRETADHSIPFLIACALEDGALSHEQFENERWLRPSTTDLMQRVKIVPDAEMAGLADSCYPARVEVTMTSGDVYSERVSPTPGSPGAPFTAADVARKFATNQRLGMDADGVERIAGEISGLADAKDLSGLLASIAPVAREARAQTVSNGQESS